MNGAHEIRFVFLTFPEVEGAAILWDETAPKSQEVIAAAIAAGFLEQEVTGSPVGFLQRDFGTFKAGARALMGMNGSTLLEWL